MTITLFVMGSLIFIGTTFDTVLETIKNKVDINVYFVPTAAEDDIFALKKSLEALPEVDSITYVSREQALSEFRERYADDQLTLQALDELSENPLGANLSIKAKETSQYEGIAQFLQSDAALLNNGSQIIDKVNYFKNKVAIDRLTKIIGAAEKFGFGITAILIVASVLITFNTIQLAIYTARDEIAVMQLVGAGRTYISGPFVFEGVLYGLVSAIITLILFYPLTWWLGPVTQSFFSNINIFSFYLSNFIYIALVIVGAGVALGILSSFLAVKKYMKV